MVGGVLPAHMDIYDLEQSFQPERWLSPSTTPTVNHCTHSFTATKLGVHASHPAQSWQCAGPLQSQSRPQCKAYLPVCWLAGLSLSGLEVAMAQLPMRHCSWHLGLCTVGSPQ